MRLSCFSVIKVQKQIILRTENAWNIIGNKYKSLYPFLNTAHVTVLKLCFNAKHLKYLINPRLTKLFFCNV